MSLADLDLWNNPIAICGCNNCYGIEGSEDLAGIASSKRIILTCVQF